MSRVVATVVAALAGLGALVVRAVPVTLEEALLAAQAWSVTSDALGAKVGEAVELATEHTTDAGAKFYTVKTVGGGTIVMTGDDELEPVLAFTDEAADWTTLDHDSPMWAFFNRHVSGMAESAKWKMKKAKLSTSAAGGAKARWAKLIEQGREIRANGLPKLSDTWRRDADITDLRVPALCKTKWQQMGNGYNYYTPNNWACGCVATAQAQIMRKHCWPTGEVEQVTKQCRVGGVSTNLTTQGGVFDWANMPYSGGHSDIQRQAVGKLCSDVGITLNMSYSSGGSGSTTPKVMYSLVNNFQYGGAVCLQYAYNAFGEYGDDWPECRRESLERIFFANFDAGLPVSVGIPGHEVLADGYGFIDGLEYVHFNFGWAGISTCWYYIPDLTGAGSEYSYVDDLVYNIMPTNDISYAIVSGRVLDHNGQPLSGVRVAMRKHEGGSGGFGSTLTDERGIWHFIVKAGEWNGKTEGDLIDRTTEKLDFEVAEFGNFKAAKLENVTVDCPTRYRLYYYGSSDPEMFGNSWGNDIRLELDNPDYPEVPNHGATFENHAVGDTNVIDEDDDGGIARETYNGKFWWALDATGIVKAGNYASFTGVVYRAIHNTYDITNTPAASVAEFVPEEIGAQGFVCDTLVRLEEYGDPATPTTYASPLLPDEDLKIAVMVKGGKLVVIAGDGETDHSTKLYETGLAVDTTTLHRLTIQTSHTSQTSHASFRVWLDGRRIAGLFPSRILEGDDADEVRSLGFAGVGIEADDVFLTRELPPFLMPGLLFLVK